MRTLHIILPMAGRGSRFANAGFTTPKPLIPVDGRPMFLKAISSFDRLDTPKRYTVILRKEHDAEYSLANQIKEALPEANIILTDEPAMGALRDAYRAMIYLEPNEGVLVMDCDIMIGGDAYFEMIRKSLSDEDDIQGGLLLFKSQEPRFSYAELDDSGLVIHTAEKQVISPYAIGGGYYLASTEAFDTNAQSVFSRPLDETHPEYFMSYIFNDIIQNGGKVRGAVGDFVSFGTPEELSAYEQSQQ
jgi:NDP-sugar pyrophosphorylase family protein